MKTFWEIKENIAKEKKDMEFHSFDCTIWFLSFCHVDLMYHTSMLNWEFPYKMKKKPTIT